MSTKLTARHRSHSSSQDCPWCHQVMRNFEERRPLTEKQAQHYEINRSVLDDRAKMEILDGGRHVG